MQKVRLSGLQIKAPAGSGPKSVKLIVNTPSLDFDSAKSTKVTQEVASKATDQHAARGRFDTTHHIRVTHVHRSPHAG